MRGRQRLAIIALMLLVAAVAVAGTAGAVQAQGRSLSTTLTGAAEVPGPGDPDGSGTATLTVNPGLGQICYELTVSGIAPATAAHIHVGTVTEAGPVVVPLAPPTDGTSSGCAEVSRELALAILKSPSDYYVNVHNAEFPAGALRGQLAK
jgi:hypothetical protein